MLRTINGNELNLQQQNSRIYVVTFMIYSRTLTYDADEPTELLLLSLYYCHFLGAICTQACIVNYDFDCTRISQRINIIIITANVLYVHLYYQRDSNKLLLLLLLYLQLDVTPFQYDIPLCTGIEGVCIHSSHSGMGRPEGRHC